ncbi:pyridoxamine 5'-phosphate oxidase family protein [Sansalvadorimonas sp. 2012CJ34-2]|uniref:Pyridoxamine 5'-phosphate oxidase family protein n=1 Tax=Parendozoicomonas callyspongiae TaxID=2942213 RepID=A0ABT0PFU0_9GAMM|nr:pyridoxamine 5'-phosphate oxidase family protein [Sansalvadorimonas sp. 2012CJ34-2]MCL6270203.1 pyridoxamine 5'-phosphate oxidase family protein [Sansalvadorimonas sp. 2012CJ34-2]
MSKMTPEELLENHYYAVLATASPEAVPWVTPIFFAYDKDWNLHWISSRSSHHSKLLSENPKACVVIYQTPGVSQETSALYISGTVSICTGAVLEEAAHLYFERAGLGVSGKAEDYSGDSPCRLYRLVPDKAHTLQEPEWEENLLLDKRNPVSLPE